jgi:hypothetical protein
VRQAIKAAGARLLFLPKYSPDLNPIEHALQMLAALILRLVRASPYRPAVMTGRAWRPDTWPHPITRPNHSKPSCASGVIHTWHLDEVFVKINGKLCCRWRAVDHEGEVLETVVTAKRDKAVALKLLKRIMKK